MARDGGYDIPIYSRAARQFHWWAVLLLVIQLPLGFYMIYRAKDMPGLNADGQPATGVWNGVDDGGLTNTMFDAHKVLGISIFILVVLRLIYRLVKGAPASDPSVPRPLTGASHLVHWALYALLIATPIIGYKGISRGEYLQVFGVNLPSITGKAASQEELQANQKEADAIFEWHERAALLLLVLAGLHIAGAVYHRTVRKDRVVERMLPKRIA